MLIPAQLVDPAAAKAWAVSACQARAQPHHRAGAYLPVCCACRSSASSRAAGTLTARPPSGSASTAAGAAMAAQLTTLREAGRHENTAGSRKRLVDYAYGCWLPPRPAPDSSGFGKGFMCASRAGLPTAANLHLPPSRGLVATPQPCLQEPPGFGPRALGTPSTRHHLRCERSQRVEALPQALPAPQVSLHASYRRFPRVVGPHTA